MRDLLQEGLRLGESLARIPWKAARRLTGEGSQTLQRAADLGESLGTLPFRTAGKLLGPDRAAPEGAGAGAPVQERRSDDRGVSTEQKPGDGRGVSAEQKPGYDVGVSAEQKPGDDRGAGTAQKPRILVLGAGYAGLTCYLELQDHLSRAYDLVLVNGDRYHWFTTELHTYVAGAAEDAVRIPLSRVVTSPGRLVVDRVEQIEPAERQVRLASGERLDYTILVFALGSDPEYYNLPGVAENSMIVGNWQGATRLRERVSRLLDGEQAAAETPHVVIAGGGLTGVEVAGELVDEYGGRLRLTVVEAGPEIMAGFAPELVKVSRDVLQSKGVTIRTGNPIAHMEPGVIHFKNGEELPCDLLVWSGGVRGSAIMERSGLDVTHKGRGKVDAYLRAEGHPEIYLVGDSAAFVDPSTGRELAPTGQAAVQMGHTAGRNILRRLRGQAEEPFVPHVRGAFASLGRQTGVGQIGEDQYIGLSAMLVKHLIEAHHAWESGGGVLPLVRRLLREPRRFLRGSAAPRVSSGAMADAHPQ